MSRPTLESTFTRTSLVLTATAATLEDMQGIVDDDELEDQLPYEDLLPFLQGVAAELRAHYQNNLDGLKDLSLDEVQRLHSFLERIQQQVIAVLQQLHNEPD